MNFPDPGDLTVSDMLNPHSLLFPGIRDRHPGPGLRPGGGRQQGAVTCAAPGSSAVPPSARRMAREGQVRQDLVFADVGVFSCPVLRGWRWCGRGGTGRRACRWTRLIPACARTARMPAARRAGTGVPPGRTRLTPSCGQGRRVVAAVAAQQVVHAVAAVTGLGHQPFPVQPIQQPGGFGQACVGLRDGGVAVCGAAWVQAQQGEEPVPGGVQVPVRTARTRQRCCCAPLSRSAGPPGCRRPGRPASRTGAGRDDRAGLTVGTDPAAPGARAVS